jgi:2-dehydro-3-deoxygluconokinase
VVALGETMLALAPPPGEPLRSAAALVVDHAGAESNTCVGLARLGFRCTWVSRLGQDPQGERILAALEAEGIDTRWVRRDPGRPTGLLFKDPPDGGVRYYREGSAASRLSPADLEGVPLEAARAVLVTGVTALLGADPLAAALALLRAARGLRVVDPNLRAGLWGSSRRAELVGRLVDHCDLLLGGEGELAEVLGAGTPEEIGRRAAARGCREVVVRSAEHLGVLEGGRWVEMETPRTGAIDPIGAGDAFNAGYLGRRLVGQPVAAALRTGVECGRAVARALGDTAGFPRDVTIAGSTGGTCTP